MGNNRFAIAQTAEMQVLMHFIDAVVPLPDCAPDNLTRQSHFNLHSRASRQPAMSCLQVQLCTSSNFNLKVCSPLRSNS